MFKGLIGSSSIMGEMLYQGKVKQVWSTDDPDILEFRFTNQISVFDQIIPSLIPRKGESLNRTTAHWFNGTLSGKLGGVFTSTSSMHGGQETTLMSMILPLLHHGMIIAGVPYSNQNLNSTRTGGTPYGPSHVSFNEKGELSNDEQDICLAYGKRFANLVKNL